jgi:uncharacterized membrane protein YgcG
MWRFLRKRRALRAYRTILFKHLRQTYGRKLFYSPEQVRDGVQALRVNSEFLCYALGMFCDQDAFDAFHAAAGEQCDYGAMRVEVFAHVANVPVIYDAQLDAGGTHHGHDAGEHHAGGDLDAAGSDCGGYDGGGFDGGGCDTGGGHHSGD